MATNFMKLALEEAQRAADKGEVPVGAVLVDSYTQEVIAQAHNLVESEQNPTFHAEMLAIHTGVQKLQTKWLARCDLYVTLEPCAMCAQAISLARINRLYFGAYDPKGGGVEHGARVYQQETCHFVPEVYGGIKENECQLLLRQFFQARRG